MRRADRPVFSAAIRLVPDPPKGSSTRSPRREQSPMASGTSLVGLTVGCIASSSIRLGPMLLTPGYPDVGSGTPRLPQPERIHVRRGALSRQISIGNFRLRISPSAVAIHEQKQ